MSEQKDLLERLGDVLKELPASFQGPVVEARAEMIRLRERATSQSNEITNLNIKLVDVEKSAKDLQANNDMLRENLHAAELQIAHLQGYQARVRQFDPVSDSDAYEDRLPRPRHERRDGASYPTDGLLRHGSLNEPSWYLRRRA